MVAYKGILMFSPQRMGSVPLKNIEIKDLDKFSPALNYLGRGGGESSH